jgi:hypothetical protein
LNKSFFPALNLEHKNAKDMDIIQSTYHKEERLAHRSVSSGLAWRTGLFTSALFIAYFFLMLFLGLHKHLLLRALNIVFLVGAIVYALKRYSVLRGNKEGKIEYFRGLRLGMMVTAIATIPFAIFIGIYLSIDIGFLVYLQEQHAEIGKYLYPTSAAMAVAMEGLSSGFLVTFIAMPYFKKQ